MFYSDLHVEISQATWQDIDNTPETNEYFIVERLFLKKYEIVHFSRKTVFNSLFTYA